MTKDLGPLNETECNMLAKVNSLPTDAERQTAYRKLDDQVRKRLKIPEDKYWGLTTYPFVGNVMLDLKRDRPKVVNKVSKSDQKNDTQKS